MAKRRRRRQHIPVSTRTYTIIVISCIEIAVFFLALLLHFKGIVIGSKLISALGTIFLVASFASVILSIRDVFEGESNLLGRIIEMALPIISFILWAGTYLLGFISL